MAISARLDGELGVDAGQLDAHLVDCDDCAAWQRHAVQLASFVDRLVLELPPPTERLVAVVRDSVRREVLFMRRVAAGLGALVGAWAATGIFPGGSASAWEALVAIVVVVAAMQSSPAMARGAAVAAGLGWVAVIGGGGASWTITLRHLLMAGAAWASWRLARFLRAGLRLGLG